MNHPSRSQREAYGRRRPMPLRMREGRQEAAGRKRPLKQAPETSWDEGLDRDKGEGPDYDVLVRLGRPQIGRSA